MPNQIQSRTDTDKHPAAQMNNHAARHFALKIVWIVMALIILLSIGKWAGKWIPQAETWIARQGIWGMLVFIIGYALLTAMFFSVDILSIAAGVMFGLGAGFLCAWAGTFFSAALIFFTGRHLAHAYVERFIKRHPKLSNINETASAKGLRIMLMLRLSPLPFAPLSYALSITHVRFRDYMVACSGMALTNFLGVYSGFVAKHVTTLASGHAHQSNWYYAMLFIMLIASVIVVIIITRIAHKALD